jgi:hypothetical protein
MPGIERQLSETLGWEPLPEEAALCSVCRAESRRR